MSIDDDDEEIYEIDNEEHMTRNIRTTQAQRMTAEEGQGVKATPIKIPWTPPMAETDEHLTHVPARDWCVHCRLAKS